jgi:hypothetical protein
MRTFTCRLRTRLTFILIHPLIESNSVLIIAVFANSLAGPIVIRQAPNLFLSLKQLKYMRHFLSFRPGVFFTNTVRIPSAVKNVDTLQLTEICNNLL